MINRGFINISHILCFDHHTFIFSIENEGLKITNE